MAIKINNQNDPNGNVDIPEIRILGKRVDTSDGSVDTITRIYNRPDEVVNGTTVSKRAVDTYRRSVTVQINPDASTRKGFDNNQAIWRKAAKDKNINDNNVFVGEQPGGIIAQNETMYTYYSLNGKQPKRSKSNLYIAPFTIRQNKSGGDNIILKAVSYINGIASAVQTVRFRIVNDQVNANQVNKLTREASSS